LSLAPSLHVRERHAQFEVHVSRPGFYLPGPCHNRVPVLLRIRGLDIRVCRRIRRTLRAASGEQEQKKQRYEGNVSQRSGEH